MYTLSTGSVQMRQVSVNGKVAGPECRASSQFQFPIPCYQLSSEVLQLWTFSQLEVGNSSAKLLVLEGTPIFH